MPCLWIADCYWSIETYQSSWLACGFPVEPGVIEPATILDGISVYTDPVGCRTW